MRQSTFSPFTHVCPIRRTSHLHISPIVGCFTTRSEALGTAKLKVEFGEGLVFLPDPGQEPATVCVVCVYFCACAGIGVEV
jgi:hypothetical protein